MYNLSHLYIRNDSFIIKWEGGGGAGRGIHFTFPFDSGDKKDKKGYDYPIPLHSQETLHTLFYVRMTSAKPV